MKRGSITSGLVAIISAFLVMPGYAKLKPETIRAWERVAQCETGGVLGYPLWDWGKYRHRSSLEGSKYEGGVGFYWGTWDWWAGELGLIKKYPHAYDAPKLVQIRVADYGLRVHNGYWGCLH